MTDVIFGGSISTGPGSDDVTKQEGMNAIPGPAAAPGPNARVPMEIDTAGVHVQRLFTEFLRTFAEAAPGSGPGSAPPTPGSDAGARPGDGNQVRVYLERVTHMKANDKTTLYVDFDHLMLHDEVLAQAISENYYRFEPYVRRALQTFVREQFPAYVVEDEHSADAGEKEFYVSFYNCPGAMKLRDLKTPSVGRLTAFSGTVTRSSEVRPELTYGTFRCLVCGTLEKDVEQQFKYTEPLMCRDAACGSRNKWQLDVEASKFVDWQRVRVQENSTEIPSGSMPRSIDVILRHEIVDKAKAGDRALFTGQLIVVPDVAQLRAPGEKPVGVSRGGSRGEAGFSQEGATGLKALGVRDLTYKLAFLASNVVSAAELKEAGGVNIRGEDEEAGNVLESFTEAEREELKEMRATPRLYNRLSSSIAPTIFGHDEVKRGLALMLFGGVHKTTPEGIELRGDINICIVGDPSTAKSQFLKYVVGFLPRAVYTSGKASSAAGLTASVMKDADTGEFCIEAGALMLADNGIACIDEFDKMDVKDQVAIHEAMEQQTISIAKAGIQATLNARTSILAAANPVGGRYNKAKSLKANVQMSPPIMSRFDLFYVIVDESDEVADYNIARHIVNLHAHRDEAVSPEFTKEQLQRYIRFARSLKPTISPEARLAFAAHYNRLRQNDVSGGAKTSYRITVRQLESMIRLSEALARVHCDQEIKVQYVDEAARLLKQSIIRVESDPIDLDEELEAAVAAIQKDADGDVEMDAGADDGAGVGGGDENTAPPTQSTGPVVKKKPILDGDSSAKSSGKSSTGTSQETQRRVVPISYEHYQRITKLLAMRMGQVGDEGMTQDQLVEWYLSEAGASITDVEQLANEARLVRNVIGRLITKDQVLLVLEEGEAPGARRLSLNANYDITFDKDVRGF